MEWVEYDYEKLIWTNGLSEHDGKEEKIGLE